MKVEYLLKLRQPISAATLPCRKFISEELAMLEVHDLHSYYGAAHVLHCAEQMRNVLAEARRLNDG